MKINNGWSVAVFASITLTLAACSGNPVEDSTVPATKVANNKVSKTKTADTTAAAKKTQSTSTAAQTFAAKSPAATKTTTLTKKQALAKKQSIAALGKSKQARVKLAQAKKRQQYLNNQRLKKERAAQKSAQAPNNNQRLSLARLGLDRFQGSQADTPNIHSPQPVKTRSPQPVATRAKQPVQTRAPIKLARTTQNLRRVALPKPPVLKRAQPRIQKAAFNRNAKRPSPRLARIDPNNSFGYALSNAAIERTRHRVRYDGKYLKIGYPWGDVPKSIGVCTDVVIRAYRRLGIDLQQEVHKDISQDFYAYPNLTKWGLSRPDPNIDHRRVYNLQAFFKRHRAELPRSRNPKDYKPGVLVTWMVGPNFPHIGVVVNRPSKADPNRLMIAHNIGAGPKVEDILFRFPMTGHYRYTPKHRKINPALIYAKTPPPAHVIRKQRNKGLTYAELLQASKILSGEVSARALPKTRDDLLTSNVTTKKDEKIMIAHLDADIGINQTALQQLLK